MVPAETSGARLRSCAASVRSKPSAAPLSFLQATASSGRTTASTRSRPARAATCRPVWGYEKCKEICQQEGHAEVIAGRIAERLNLRGGIAYIEGHTYACAPCQEALLRIGVVAFMFAPPPLPDGDIVLY